MPTNIFNTLFYNATGVALTWVNSGSNPDGSARRILATGAGAFAMHFGPISGRLQLKIAIFGAETQWQAVCDYGLAIGAGDIIYLTGRQGQTLTSLEFYHVRGVDIYPSLYLPHYSLFLAKFQQ